MQIFRSLFVRNRTLRPQRAWRSALLWAAVPALSCAALALIEPAPIRAVRDLAFDTFLRWKPRIYDPATPVRVVDIDEESLTRVGQWPWPRTILAELVRRIGGGEAAAISLDILLSEPDRTSPEQLLRTLPASPARDAIAAAAAAPDASHDNALARAIQSFTVTTALFGAGGASGPPPLKAGFAWAGDPAIEFLRPTFSSATVPMPPIRDASRGLGAMNVIPDRDAIVRRAPSFIRVGDAIVPGLALETLRIAQDASTFVIKSSNASGAAAFGAKTGIVSVKIGDAVVDTEADGQIRIYFSGSHPARRIPAWKVLAGDAPPDAFKGRIVFVGASAAALSDLRASPIESGIAGVDVHAELIEHIAAGAHLARPDYARGLEAVTIVFAGALAALLGGAIAPALGVVLALAGAAGLAVGAWMFFAQAGLLFDPILPPFALLASFGAATVASYRRAEKDRAQIRDAFGRYVSPAVIEALIADPSKLALGGVIRPVTVLFSDIRNFTQRSERLDAADVVRFLNSVHTPMSDAVMARGGTIDKYIGDGMMAFWNAPLDDADHVRNALRVALTMIELLPGISQTLAAENPGADGPPLGLGVGINTGLACVGNLGSDRRLEYSIVGDTVNSAARLEPLCKDYGVPIIVSQAVVDAAPGFAFLEIDETALRGRQSATRIFALIGDETTAQREDFRSLQTAHMQALAAMRDRRSDAPELIAACEARNGGAALAGVYRKWREKLAAPISAPA